MALAGNVSIVADLATGFVHGGIAGTSPNQMTESGGKLFFIGNVLDPSDGTWPGRSPRSEGLWVTDGTGQGTQLVKEIIAHVGGFNKVLYLTDVSGTLFFGVAPDGFSATELWKSDGTTAGTVLIKRFDAGTYRHLAHLTALNGRLAFELHVTTRNEFGGFPEESQLWISDGTTTGTLQVATFDSIDTGTHAQFGGSLARDTPFFGDGRSIYFSATHKPQAGATFGELHRFDGASVTSVKAFPPSSPRLVSSFTKTTSEIFFSWGNDLWRTDGTSAGTQLVTTTTARSPSLLTTVGDTVFFNADDANVFTRDQIMRTDGTPGGTQTVLTLDTVSPNAITIAAVSGKVIVFAGQLSSASTANVTAWSIDPLTNSSQRLGFFPAAIRALAPRSKWDVEELRGRVYFTANDNLHGWELWETDGTVAGTSIHDVWQPAGSNVPPGSSSSYPNDLTAFGGGLYFGAFAEQFGDELWKLVPSGTPAQQPNISLASSASSLGPNQTATISFTLSESSSNFTVNDVMVSGGTLTNFAGAGTRYTATYVPNQSTVTTGSVFVSANVFSNSDGTGNAASSTLLLSINTVVPSVSVAEVGALEGNAGTTFVDVLVTLSSSSALPVSMDYATVDGTARALGADYVPTAGTLTFLPGETQKAIRVAINGDAAAEPHENFSVVLSNAVNASVPPELVGRVNIFNDDGRSAVFVDDIEVVEGTGGTTTATFSIQLAVPMPHRVSVRYASLERTAKPRDRDYQSVAGTVFIPAGQTSVNVPVTIIGDSKYEPDEKVAFWIVSAVGVPITRPIAHCTILNDDPVPVPTVTISDVRLTEGPSSQKMFAFMVRLSERSPVTVSVDFQTIDGTAVAGLDYVGRSGTLAFFPGLVARSITVWVTGDTTFEATERFSLQLFGASNATLGRSIGIGTIVNDDKPSTSRGVTAAMFAAFAAEQSPSKPIAARRR